MRKLQCFLLFMFILLIPYNANALCSSQEKARLKKLVSNINVSYDYKIVNNDAIFQIKFSNVSPELYFKDVNQNVYKTYSWEENEIILYDYPDGGSNNFIFYANKTCSGEKVGNIYVNLPTYNPFYQLSVCDGASEYKLCQKWVKHSLNRIEFINNVKEYKTTNGIIDDSEIHKQISIVDFAVSFIRMYGIYALIIIIVVILIIKIIRYKKDTFGF